MIEKYANPQRLEKICSQVILPCMVISCLLFACGLYFGLWASPPDYQQKETVRIMYIHVPAAWHGMGIFLSMGICSFFVFWRRHHTAYLIAKALAPIGTALTLICLVTGALWGRPTWGTYWIWDARLTSMLILLFLYIGYLFIINISDTHKTMKIASIFCMISLIDIPIIKFSVEWWNTLHQGASVIRTGGTSIHISMLTPLLIMAAAYLFMIISLTCLGIKSQLLTQKINRKIRQHIEQDMNIHIGENHAG